MFSSQTCNSLPTSHCKIHGNNLWKWKQKNYIFGPIILVSFCSKYFKSCNEILKEASNWIHCILMGFITRLLINLCSRPLNYIRKLDQIRCLFRLFQSVRSERGAIKPLTLVFSCVWDQFKTEAQLLLLLRGLIFSHLNSVLFQEC